ncbi:MAG: hypothetical protein V4726_10625 [Verrucomicrobiota bacterium]
MTRRNAIWLGAAALVVTGMAVAGWWVHHSRNPVGRPSPPVTLSAADAAAGASVTTSTDPVKVFQMAFWRRPAEGDLILNAERREWTTAADGVRKWQWFLAVKTGPALKSWLARNPFALSEPPATSAPGLLAAAFPSPYPPPDWFPRETGGLRIQKHRAGPLMLLFSADGSTVYAADAGGGFTPAPVHGRSGDFPGN